MEESEHLCRRSRPEEGLRAPSARLREDAVPEADGRGFRRYSASKALFLRPFQSPAPQARGNGTKSAIPRHSGEAQAPVAGLNKTGSATASSSWASGAPTQK